MLKHLTIFVFAAYIANFGNAATTKPPKCPKENCTSQFQEAFECMKNAFEDNEDQIRKRFTENEDKLGKCFKDSKCSVPSGDPYKNEPETPEIYKCVNAIINKVISSVNRCVEKKLDCEIPDGEFNFTARHQFHPQIICDVLNKSCDTYGDGEGVLKCANNVFKDQSKAIHDDYNKFCGAQSKCIKKLTKGCHCQFFQIASTGETCSKDIFKNGDFIKDLPECKGMPDKPQDDRCASAQMLALTNNRMDSENRQICSNDVFEKYQKEHYNYGSYGNDTKTY